MGDQINLQKSFNRLAGLALVMAICLVALVQYQKYIRKSPLHYDNLPFPAALVQPKPGEARVISVFPPGVVVPIWVTRCNLTDKPISYTVTHTLEDVATHQTYALPAPVAGGTLLFPGCETTASQFNKTPDDQPNGEYRFYGSGSGVDVNGIAYLEIWYSENFSVRNSQ